MGVFNTYGAVRGGNQKITENFLKKMGFKKSNQWGAPSTWGPNSEYWELTIMLDGFASIAELIYFPPTFNAWVTSFNSNGMTPANKILAMISPDMSSKYDFTASALCKMDIYYGIDRITENLKTYLKIN